MKAKKGLGNAEMGSFLRRRKEPLKRKRERTRSSFLSEGYFLESILFFLPNRL
jgi:hypothetical protein